MNANLLAVAASAALILAGCSVGKPIPTATTYVVDLPMPADRTTKVERPETLRMGDVRVAAAYGGAGLVYRVDDVRYASDPYNAFIAEPGAMLGNRIAEWLDRAGPFKTVAQPGSGRSAPFVLEATVTELYGDFRPGRTPAAVVAVQFALVDLSGPRRQVTFESTIGRRAELPQASADALVRGYGKALGDILAQLVSELGAQTSK